MAEDLGNNALFAGAAVFLGVSGLLLLAAKCVCVFNFLLCLFVASLLSFMVVFTYRVTTRVLAVAFAGLAGGWRRLAFFSGFDYVNV